MFLKYFIKQASYFDSITLMATTSVLSDLPDVKQVVMVMASEAGLEDLAIAGLLPPDLPALAATDLLCVVQATTEERAIAALVMAEARLERQDTLPAGSADAPAKQVVRSLEQALKVNPQARFVSISVPGPYAALECELALRAGLHVFLFSDNVPLEAEISLKRLAAERQLLLMGPDCGTALLQGVRFGFVNVVPTGPIGIVGASGTGIQQVMSLLAAQGLGISQAIGCGGRDLSEAVGGMTAGQGLRMLQDDPETRVIVLISKPPAPAVAEQLLSQAAQSEKPVVVCFVGAEPAAWQHFASVDLLIAENLTQAATLAAQALTGKLSPILPEQGVSEKQALLAPTRRLVGLFAGGTLCDEAMHLWKHQLSPIYSNIPLRPEWQLQEGIRGHSAIDFGDDAFTRGRPHPMIDPSQRLNRFEVEANDSSVGVILLDMVLGYCAHPDPAAVHAPTIQTTLERARTEGRPLACVISLCGTEDDPQSFSRQARQFRAAGAEVYLSNVEAALRCLALLQEQEGR